MTRHFVSAGWPYLYDVPGLHNCVPMIFADVTARYYRHKGEEVFYLCGADEHGARTEYVAQGYGTTPQELLDTKFNATLPLLADLQISFDAFERTGDVFHKKFVQDFFKELEQKEMLLPGQQNVAWCSSCQQHLPDRLLVGECPHCSGKSYGNQCNNKKDCARLIESDHIQNAKCAVCAKDVDWQQSNHLFFRMGIFQEQIQRCAQAPTKDVKEVRRRIQQAVSENQTVCVTRDTRWGIPLPQMTNKSVYSWVDSLLAKVSMLAKRGQHMEDNYWKDPNTHKHFFLGMDGTPFYGSLLPSLLLASEKGYCVTNWNLMPNEVFIYEGGACSKSTETGIWLAEALSILPADFWRFYIFFTQAGVESGSERDVDFRWDRFCQSVNTWLIEGLSNVINNNIEADSHADFNEDIHADSDGEQEAAHISQLIEDGKLGQSFIRVLTAIVEQPNPKKTARLAPLLKCFLPTAGEALIKGENPFARDSLYYCDVQLEYQTKIEARKAKCGFLEEIIAGAPAEVLNIDPMNNETVN